VTDYKRVLDWWWDSLDSLIQCVTTLYSSLLHTHARTSVHSHVCTSRCSVANSIGGHSLSSGFRNYCWPQLSASNSKNSQRPNLNSSLTGSVTHQQTLFTNSTDSVMLITSRHGPHRKHPSSVAVSLRSPSVWVPIVALETCFFAPPMGSKRFIICFLISYGALCYKPEGREFESGWGNFFLIYLILSAALWPWGWLSL
jgi:hypothetical protein